MTKSENCQLEKYQTNFIITKKQDILNKIQLLSLKNQKAFNRASAKSVKFTAQSFMITVSMIQENHIILSNTDVKPGRLPVLYGFKVSRKIGKSHERNLIKRRMKNIYHKIFQVNYCPLSIIFIPRKTFKDLNFSQMEDEVTKSIIWCVKKLGQNSLHHKTIKDKGFCCVSIPRINITRINAASEDNRNI
ncbi:MAG: ribonuclease P protein component [Rickettsiaceae bacterium]|nr:ribonuclease P protein component [Rickettsiaceae bacterium]